MSVEEVLGAEVGRLRGYLDRLWSLTKSEKLDRKECLNIISDINRSFNAIFNAFALHFSNVLAKLSPQEPATYNTLFKALTGKELTGIYAEVLHSTFKILYPSELSRLRRLLEANTFYEYHSDDEVIYNIT